MASFDTAREQDVRLLDGSNINCYCLNNARNVTERLLRSRQEALNFREKLYQRGAHLVPASTFDYHVYKLNRSTNNSIHGLLYHDHSVAPVSLPVASTAIPADPGQACLRALCATMLCLYGTAPATEILKHLVSYALLDTSPLNADAIFDDVLTRALRRWVHAVGIEEENLPTRQEMLGKISSVESTMTNIYLEDVMNQDLGQPTEISFIAGVLQWALTPREERASVTYPTCSVRAWRAAVILSEFGFDVLPASHIATSFADYDRFRSGLDVSLTLHVVVLIAEPDAEVDPLAFDTRSPPERHPMLQEITPLIIPMRKIPALAFRHLAGDPFRLDTEELEEAWIYSFRSARNMSIGFARPTDNFDFQLRLDSIGAGPMTRFQYSLLSIFIVRSNWSDTKVAPICPHAMAKYIPASEVDISWNPDLIKTCLYTDAVEGYDPVLLRSVQRNAYILKAIIFGALYGICSTALALPSPFVDDSDDEALATEVAMRPDIAFPAKFRKLQHWTKEISNMYVGKSNSLRSVIDHWRYLLIDMFIARSTSGSNPAIGAQRNGLTLISEFVVRPTMDAKAMFSVRLLRGLPLNLPSYYDDGIIRSSGYCASPFTGTFNTAPALTHLPVSDPSTNGSTLRLDVEPYWMADNHPVVLEVRLHDNPLAQFGLWDFFRLLPRFEPCECGHHTSQIRIPAHDHSWRQVTIQHLLQIAPQGLGEKDDHDSRGLNYFVDASQSESMTIFALGMLQGIQHKQIVWDCFDCAVRRLTMEENAHVPNFALILPWGFPSAHREIWLNRGM